MQDNVLTANLLSQASGVFVTFILKEYDFVFDVEIQEGSPRLKLPYNLTGMRYYYIVFFYIIILLRCTKFHSGGDHLRKSVGSRNGLTRKEWSIRRVQWGRKTC